MKEHQKFLETNRKSYLHHFTNHWQEYRYWSYEIQNTFEQMAKVIRKGI